MLQECIVAAPSTGTTVTRVRSTLIQSSLRSLKDLGHGDRYLQHLATEHQERILGSIAPEWLPIEVGEAHYAACEALALSDEEMLRVGQHVGERIQGTFLGTLARRARVLGLTPWTLLGSTDRLWDRVMMGGRVAVFKIGPKDVRIDIDGLSLAEVPYFREAFRGVIAAGIQLGAGKSARVNIRSQRALGVTFHGMWV